MRRRDWTRKRYEHARRLSRLLGALATSAPIQAPSIVESYRDLMRPLEQQVDPMDEAANGYRNIRRRLQEFWSEDGVPF